jgi:YidC/Oxa1 family membrane protein insertase
MVLILAYQLIYYMPRMKKYEEARRAQTASVRVDSVAAGGPSGEHTGVDTLRSAADSLAATVEAAAAEDFPTVEAAPARRVTVKTPLYDVVLSSAGAEVVSMRLTQFKTLGEPVELVARGDNPAAAGGVAEVTLLGDEKAFPLESLSFAAFKESGTVPLEDGAVVSIEAGGSERVSFRATGSNGGEIERYYVFTADSYVIRSGVRFGSAALPFVRSVRWGLGPGLRPTEANPQEDLIALRASLRLGDEFHRKKRGDFDERYSGTVNWAALQVKYFTLAIMPEAPVGGQARLEGRKTDGFMTASIELPAAERQGRVDQAVELFMGPINFSLLKSMGRGLEKNVELGVQYFRPISAAVLWSLLKLHGIIPNYGVVILLISVFTKVLFYRLTHKSFKSMREMQALQPKLQALKEKFKNDRQRLSQETMKLYKEAGVNPLGGCLPMLLQMPVFIALFNVLRNTIELRQAPFFGWINDLSQQDVLFTLPFAIPILGNAVSVLPVLMGAGMLVQSKIGGSIAGPESSPTQSKSLQYMLPVVFTFLFYKMPSGLVLYWLVNTVLSVWQQYYINKGAEKEEREKIEAARRSGRTETEIEH